MANVLIFKLWTLFLFLLLISCTSSIKSSKTKFDGYVTIDDTRPAMQCDASEGGVKSDTSQISPSSTGEILSVPHNDNLVNLDLIFNSKVKVVLEDGDPGEQIVFHLQTASDLYGTHHASTMSLHHTTKWENGVRQITVHVAEDVPVENGTMCLTVTALVLVSLVTLKTYFGREPQTNNGKIWTTSIKTHMRNIIEDNSPVTLGNTSQCPASPQNQQIRDACPRLGSKETEKRDKDDMKYTDTFSSFVSRFLGNTKKRWPSLPTPAIVCFSLTVMAAVVCALSSYSLNYYLRIKVPSNTHIRRIRSYSENPSISALTVNSSSMALVTRVHIMDVKAMCKKDLTKCETFAVCDTIQGFLNCRCKRGYYVKNRECSACSTSCPDGYYMTHQCSAHRDVICRECSKCSGSEYEAASCTSTQNTICLDVNFPMSSVNWDAKIRETGNSSSKQLAISTSNNVFVEKLSRIKDEVKDEKTTLFFNNNLQQMEFPFIRESGLEIKFKVSQTYLVPEYVDLEHIDDTQFFKKDQYIKENMRQRMKYIQKNFCRHVLPDQYKLILDLIQNQYTVANIKTCSPTDAPCPQGFREGDKYLNRNLYIKCPYNDGKGGNFTQLFNNVNLIYCSLPNQLLTEAFGLKPVEIEQLNFPTRECQQHANRCQKCLQQCEDTRTSSDELPCCKIPCYSQPACQRFYSDACPKKPTECARGDVYRYSLEPMFESLKKKFMCHLKYRKPRNLYTFTYTVGMPSIGHTFKTRYFAPEVKNKMFHQRGRAKHQFINIMHDTFSRIHNEVILVGSKFENNTPTQFVLQPLKTPEQFNTRKRFRVRPHRSDLWPSNVYSTQVQFERPFLYSSVTWSDSGCNKKNFSQFYPPQNLYTSEKLQIQPTISTRGGKFLYEAMPMDRPGLIIRVKVNGNESILSYYQNEIGKTRVIGSSLQGQLDWLDKEATWIITINGTLTKCPGYLTMDVFDQFMQAHFGQYDVFVKCPSPSFSISFLLHLRRSDTPNIFAVFINDTDTSHKILLSMMVGPTSIPVRTELTIVEHIKDEFPWMPIIVILIFSAITLAIFLLAAIFISKIRKVTTDDVFKYPGVTFINKEEERLKPDDGSGQTVRPISHRVTCVLITLYVVYALMFTFTVLLGVFYIIQGPLIGNLTIVSNTSAKIHQAVQVRFTDMQNFESSEVSRLYKETNDRFRACAHHSMKDIERITRQTQKNLHSYIKNFYSRNETIEIIVRETLKEKSKILDEELDLFLKEYNKTLQNHFKTILSKYRTFLKSLMKNDWLKFPEKLFIGQKEVEDDNAGEDHLLGFMKWLEVEQVEETLHVTDNIIKKGKRIIMGMSWLSTTLPNLQTSLELPTTEEDILVSSIDEITNQMTSYNFLILEPDSNGIASILNPRNKTASSHSSSSYKTTANMIQKIKAVLFPVFICVFLLMDILLLLYRFTWLRQMYHKAHMGVEEKVATDHVAGKIHFTLTGNDVESRNDPMDKPYNYMMDNKEFTGKKEMYLMYVRASPKNKEEILQNLWTHKQKQKQRHSSFVSENLSPVSALVKILSFIYKHLISPLLWRFVLVCAFILIISLITKTTNDLVTIDTATFLMDTRSILPQLHRQIEITNSLLNDFSIFSNDLLRNYSDSIIVEANSINTLLGTTLQKQTEVVNSLISDLCSIGTISQCQDSRPILTLSDSVQHCNFLPVQTHFLQEFRDETFMEYLHTELLPLVVTLRHILFNTCYILFAFACLMLISHIFIRVIVFYLLKTNRLPKVTMYLVSNANECWKASSCNPHSSVYRSHSLIESCESGVVGDMDDHYRDPTTIHPTQPHH